MNVILLERVNNLGDLGDEVSVKAGFARNFLLPKKKAVQANDANRAIFEKKERNWRTPQMRNWRQLKKERKPSTNTS